MSPPTSTNLAIARVQPLTRTRAIRGQFDYRLRPDKPEAVVGSVLRVPFGRQRTLGVVVELANQTEVEPDRLAEPDAVLPAGVPADLVDLARWMADEYCSTLARALSLLLAPGATDGVGHRNVLVAGLTDAGRDALLAGDRLNDRQKALLETLERDGQTAAATLGTPALRRLQKRGLVDVRPQAQLRRPAGVDVGLRLDSPPALTADQR